MADPEINLGEPPTAPPMVAPFAPMGVAPMPVPVPAPGQQQRFATSTALSPQALQTLREQGFPSGLAKEMGNARARYPIRFWVVDNSGSMRTSDGQQLRGAHNALRIVPCTRWKELQGTVEYHAQLAGLIEAETSFRLLNDPGAHIGPQTFAVADSSNGIPIDQEVDRAIATINASQPVGVTPLSDHLREIRICVESVTQSLRSQGQKAVIVIATDGLPSDDNGSATKQVKREFIQSLRNLQSLPVWIVIRLCTDDDSVVDFYNNLDRILELPLEVMDDFQSEAKEIYGANPWLNYTLQLHRCREMGYQHQVFDLLDERKLNKDELLEFLTLLFGDNMKGSPDLHTNWKGFLSHLETVVSKEKNQWNSHTKRLGPWVDIKKLKKCYGGGGFRLFGK